MSCKCNLHCLNTWEGGRVKGPTPFDLHQTLVTLHFEPILVERSNNCEFIPLLLRGRWGVIIPHKRYNWHNSWGDMRLHLALLKIPNSCINWKSPIAELCLPCHHTSAQYQSRWQEFLGFKQFNIRHSPNFLEALPSKLYE